MINNRRFQTPPRRLPKSTSPIVIQVAAFVIALVMVAPLLLIFSLSLKSPPDMFRYPPAWIPFVQFTPTAQNWQEVFSLSVGSVTTPLINSTLVAGISTIFAVGVGSLAGYGLARFRYSVGNQNLMFFLLIPRLIPSIVIAVPLFLIVREADQLDTLTGLIFAHTTLLLPLATLIMREYFAGFSNSVTEAARVDGAGLLQTFRLIALPNARAALVATAILCFIISWNDLDFALIFTNSIQNSTAPLWLLRFQAQYMAEWGPVAAMVIIVIALPIALSFLVQRYIFTGLSLGIAQE